MSAIDKLASKVGRKDDLPNQKLARNLAADGDTAAIAEIVAGLDSHDRAVQSDCIKVLYEVGYCRPELISCYASDFLRLLASRNNRLAWGAMIALSTVASLNAHVILDNVSLVYQAMACGSVITVDNGVKVLAAAAAGNPDNNADMIAYLLNHLKTCRAKEVPQHAESTLIAIVSSNKNEFVSVLKARETDMTPSQMARIKRLYRVLDNV